LPAISQPNQNIRLTAATSTIPGGGLTLYSLNVVETTASTNNALNFTNAGDQLVLNSGGLMIQNVNSSATGVASIGTPAIPGQITSGFANGTGSNDLYLFYQNNTAANVLTVNSDIVDNSGTSVRLVATGGDFGLAYSNITLAGANTFSGGTMVNGATLTIAPGTGVTTVLPAPLSGTGLTINNGTVTSILASNAIAPQSVVLNGGATLNLTGTSNTLTTLTFNDNGGAAPTISNAGVLLTLTGGSIMASSDNPVGPATIAAGTIEIGSGAFTITTNPVTIDGTAEYHRRPPKRFGHRFADQERKRRSRTERHEHLRKWRDSAAGRPLPQ
jgi:fibronectin-binding autotransporter adhesin